MKKIFILPVLLIQLCCLNGQAQGVKTMSPFKWHEDLQYLNKKIQKEFQSFDPTVKEKFRSGIETLETELTKFNNQQIAIMVGQLVAGLGDGHTEMSILQRNANFDRLPLIFYFFEEGLFIVGGQDQYKQYIGSRVLSIGGKSIPEVIALLGTIMTKDNEYEVLHAGPSFIAVAGALYFLGLSENPGNTRMALQLASGIEKEVIFEAISIDDYLSGNWNRLLPMNNIESPLFMKHPEMDYWFQYEPEQKIMYFNYSSVNNQKGRPSLKQFTKELFKKIDELKPEKLVIDIRRNTGGNYYKSRPLIEEIIKRPWLNESGKIYAITGRMTFSAAMVTSIFLKRETQALLIGEPSRGNPNSSDNVEYMDLPNSGLRLEYTTRVKKHWPELGDATSVPIDVKIPTTFGSYSQGIDPIWGYIVNN